MGMELFNIIKRVGIFIICAQVIVHFRPDASYEKYLKMLVSMIVLIMILSPIFRLFGMEGFSVLPKHYESVLDIDISKINSKFNNLEVEENGMYITEEHVMTEEGRLTEEGEVPSDSVEKENIESIVIEPVEVEQ